MSVVISNVSTHADLSGPNDYVVHLSGKPVIAQFSHVRSEGLAACLRRAADAVEAAEHPDRARLPRQDGEIRKAALEEAAKARPESEWHEDDGFVTWWCWRNGRWLGEPAWIGTPNDSDWPDYHTHWTPHPRVPTPPALSTPEPLPVADKREGGR